MTLPLRTRSPAFLDSASSKVLRIREEQDSRGAQGDLDFMVLMVGYHTNNWPVMFSTTHPLESEGRAKDGVFWDEPT